MVAAPMACEQARLNGSPNEAAVCRAMKTSKETVVGVVAALEDFVVRLSLCFSRTSAPSSHLVFGACCDVQNFENMPVRKREKIQEECCGSCKVDIGRFCTDSVRTPSPHTHTH
jgi:hypothetical protein